jgi:dTDP-4-dehydrorhamnose reductase
MRTLQAALDRVLEVLQPAAARAATAALLAAHLACSGSGAGKQRQQPAAASAAVAAAADNTLSSLSVRQVARLVGQMPPDTQTALQDDLGTYCRLCHLLRCGLLHSVSGHVRAL